MKKLFYISILTVFTSCLHFDWVCPSGDIVTETRNVSNFEKISVSSGIELIVYNGRKEVLVETYENIQCHIETYVKKNCLYIKPTNHTSFKGNTRIKVYVTNDYISSIEATGGSRVQIPELLLADELSLEGTGGARFTGEIRSRLLDIEITGGGKADLYVDCVYLAAEATGGGTLNLEGIADKFDLDMSGGGSANAFYLDVDELYADLSGGAVANVTVNNYIVAELSGGSKIRYKGSPQINADTSGGSKVVKAD